MLDTFSDGIVNPSNFDPSTSIPDLSGKVIIVTGGNTGIGKQTVLQLSKHSPARIYLTARSKSKYDAAMTDILQANPSAKDTVRFLEMDLTSLASVKSAASTFLSENGRLDILINNAGIMGHSPAQTLDGYEIHFGVNYLGPALLTHLLLPLLTETAHLPAATPGSVRAINVSSAAGYTGLAPKLDLDTIKTSGRGIHSFKLYSLSKLAQIHHAQTLSSRHPDITCVAIHPGRVSTTLLDNFFRDNKRDGMKWFQKIYDRIVGVLSVEQGALNSLWAATAETGGPKSGGLYAPVGREVRGDGRCRDEGERERLRQWTEKEIEKAM